MLCSYQALIELDQQRARITRICNPRKLNYKYAAALVSQAPWALNNFQSTDAKDSQVFAEICHFISGTWFRLISKYVISVIRETLFDEVN